MHADNNIIKDKSRKTHFASGVPGSVDGLLRAWKDHGSGNISRVQLLSPAIRLAEGGFNLSEYEADRFNNNKDRLSQHSETKRIFTRDDREWKEGDIFVQEDLANTLKRIANEGRDGFYKGKTAQLIVEEMKNVGGWITYKDLEKRLKERDQDSIKDIENRLAEAKKEISKGVKFDYLILNDNFEDAVKDLKGILIGKYEIKTTRLVSLHASIKGLLEQ